MVSLARNAGFAAAGVADSFLKGAETGVADAPALDAPPTGVADGSSPLAALVGDTSGPVLGEFAGGLAEHKEEAKVEGKGDEEAVKEEETLAKAGTPQKVAPTTADKATPTTVKGDAVAPAPALAPRKALAPKAEPAKAKPEPSKGTNAAGKGA